MCALPLPAFRVPLPHHADPGRPDPRYRSYWEEAHSLFPDWPGFDAGRQSTALRPVYERFVEQAKADIRELFPEPIR